MRQHGTLPRCFSVWFLVGLALVVLAGCGQTQSSSQIVDLDEASDDESLSDDELRDLIDSVLVFTHEHRQLNLKDHAAWQILHGALAYQQDFLVTDGEKSVSAVDHILSGGYMKGWTTRPGIVLDEASNRRGLVAEIESGTKTGQGHADQWLAVLAQCELDGATPIQVGNQTYTLQDYVDQVKWDLPRNVQSEYSWTLIGLTSYIPTNAAWKASDGKQWSIERLVDIEAGQALQSSACGGTHRLIGMSMALNRHIAQDGKVQGAWKKADDVISKAIQDAKQYQNADGAFSSNYFARPGASPDLAAALGSTGHTLEFLTLSLTEKELRQPWMRRAVIHLCRLFEQTESVPLECGALYHAAHGLVLYRLRMFGPRTYGANTADAKTAATANNG